ncbi:hypothetical protein SO802_008808 [Lithocarpus litseifolius]|uniref:Uncharacterized protein n=1 Tax=Lithocarpus litseifolius TaxID=425828 RepID=A0AAW2DDV6_9ROSI
MQYGQSIDDSETTRFIFLAFLLTHHCRSSRIIADPIHHPPHPLRSPAHLCRSRRCLPQPIALVFRRSQGIELSNPQAHAHQLGSGIQSTYFSETGTFSKIKRT